MALQSGGIQTDNHLQTGRLAIPAFYGAATCGDARADDGETESGSARPPITRVVQPIERRKDPIKLFLGDSRSRINDLNFNAVLTLNDRDFDRTSIAGIPDRVADYVRKGAYKAFPVRLHSNPRIHVDVQLDARRRLTSRSCSDRVFQIRRRRLNC